MAESDGRPWRISGRPIYALGEQMAGHSHGLGWVANRISKASRAETFSSATAPAALKKCESSATAPPRPPRPVAFEGHQSRWF